MRFDDMVTTVLALPRTNAVEKEAVWRQLVDLLAQRDDLASSANHIEAFSQFEELQQDLPDDVKVRASNSLVGRKIMPWLMAYFADEKPAIAKSALLGADIEPEEWVELLPHMRSSSRALLRHRGDLPEDITRLLGQFGGSDMVIEGTIGGVSDVQTLELAAEQIIEDDPAPNSEQIRDIVARIEAYRQDRSEKQAATPAVLSTEEGVTEFRFEAGIDGVIHWVEGAPRGPLIGQTIAFSADALNSGVDGQAAGAFRQRAPFRGARLLVAGEGPASGAWRISAVPFFGEDDGRFGGYRGMARRPRQGEEPHIAKGAQPGMFGSDVTSDSLRQLVHELRTPLNAITGFSEMIEKQLLGPVSESYRQSAAQITLEAGRLLQSVDDLDAAARVDTDRLDVNEGETDGAELLLRLHDDYVDQAKGQGADLVIRIEEGVAPLAIEPAIAERMVERLFAATLGLATKDEIIVIAFGPGQMRDRATMRFARPVALDGLDERELLDPEYSPDGDWPDAPALGLGFALRLVRNIAVNTEGELRIENRHFVLHLPTKDASALSGEQGQ